MRHPRHVAPVVVFALMAATAPVFAEDQLAEIVKKSKIDARDRARIETKVKARAKKLSDAGSNAGKRETARAKLIETAKTEAASQVGLDTYAEVCAAELARLTTHEVRETAWDAVYVLDKLNNANTAVALATALRSRHADARYTAARSLRALHGQLARKPRVCRTVLRALGVAGAKEKQAPVLRAVYEAIDFGVDGGSARLANDCAAALNKVFEGRLERLAAGERRDARDALGYKAAATCYGAASMAQKKLLMKHMAGFLTHAVDRCFAADTADGHRPTLIREVKQVEDPIHAMIGASKKRPPSNSVHEALQGGGSAQRRERAARAALSDLMTILRGDPWNLP
jgi:hypothetical protein